MATFLQRFMVGVELVTVGDNYLGTQEYDCGHIFSSIIIIRVLTQNISAKSFLSEELVSPAAEQHVSLAPSSFYYTALCLIFLRADQSR